MIDVTGSGDSDASAVLHVNCLFENILAKYGLYCKHFIVIK